MPSHRIGGLLDWCHVNGITLSGIELVDHEPHNPSIDKASISVVARRDLTYSDIVAKIPKPIVLSRKTSGLLGMISNVEVAWDDMIELTLILTYEILLGEKSKWSGYLQSLPPQEVPVAALWEGSDDQDSRLAFLWLQGTETKKAIGLSIQRLSVSQTLSNYLDEIASPILTSLGYQVTLSDLRRAWSLVSSRSFRVDSFHGLAMVPIADAFNHTAENQVHIETDFDVCPICGALQSCPHDDDDDEEQPAENVPAALEDTCDMVINAPVGAGDEVFNSYDANLPNSVLLARYGFILEGNEFDYLSWDFTSLPQCLQISTTSHREDLLRVWTTDLLAETSLVYDPTEYESSEGRGGARTAQYKLSADGLVSVDLWILAAMCALKATDPTCLDNLLRSRLERLATVQLCAENDGEPKRFRISPTISEILELRLVASLLKDMCRTRLLGMYRPELSAVECGNLLDDLPDTMIRSRLAICQALGERATLSACIDAWCDLVEHIDTI